MSRPSQGALIFTLTLLILPQLTCSSCSSSKPVSDDKMNLERSQREGSVSRRWTRKLPGLASDLSLSADGSRVLVSLVPDPEGPKNDDSVREPALGLMNEKGKWLWKKKLDARPKWNFLSPQADYAFVTTFEGKMRAFNGDGKELWSVDDYCRPYFLSKSERVLCFRGDDAKPTGIGFRIYDKTGKKVAEHPISGELVDSNVSADERWVALATNAGKIQLIDVQQEATSANKPQELSVGAEIAAVSVSSGDAPVVAAFYYKKSATGKHGATVSIFDKQGKKLDTLSIDGRFEQLALSPSGKMLTLAGNNPTGQTVVALQQDAATGKFKEVWRQKTPRYSDYTSPLAVMDERIIMGFEEAAPGESGQSLAHLYAFDTAGKVEWSVPLVGEEGGYLFAYSHEKKSPVLVSVSDSGEISAYELE